VAAGGEVGGARRAGVVSMLGRGLRIFDILRSVALEYIDTDPLGVGGSDLSGRLNMSNNPEERGDEKRVKRKSRDAHWFSILDVRILDGLMLDSVRYIPSARAMRCSRGRSRGAPYLRAKPHHRKGVISALFNGVRSSKLGS
jgi:hypothetical protein